MAEFMGNPLLSNLIPALGDGSVNQVVPKLGQTRCYWMLLSAHLQIMFLDPVLQQHMGPQGPLLEKRCILDFIHPQEVASARDDLSKVLSNKGLDGSVTRVRFLRLTTIRLKFGAPEHALDHFPGQDLVRFDEDYLACDLVINWVAEGVVLCFIHAIVDMSDRDNDQLNRTDWTNWCGTSVMEARHAEGMYEALSKFPDTLHEPLLNFGLQQPPPSPSSSSGSSPLVRHQAPDVVPDRIFQLLTNDSRRILILSWPDHPGVNKDDFARLIQEVNLNMANTGNEAKTSCTRRFKSPKKMRDSITGKLRNVESIFIPHGRIIFACHRVVPSRSEQQYFSSNVHSSQLLGEPLTSFERSSHSHSHSGSSSNSSPFHLEPSYPQPLHYDSRGVLVPTSPASYHSYQLQQLQTRQENQQRSSTSPPTLQPSRQPSFQRSFSSPQQRLPSIQSPSASPRYSNYGDSPNDYHQLERANSHLSDMSYQGDHTTFVDQEAMEHQSRPGPINRPGSYSPRHSASPAHSGPQFQSSQIGVASNPLSVLLPPPPQYPPSLRQPRLSPLDSESSSSSQWGGYPNEEGSGEGRSSFGNFHTTGDPYHVGGGAYARSGPIIPPLSSIRGSLPATEQIPRHTAPLFVTSGTNSPAPSATLVHPHLPAAPFPNADVAPSQFDTASSQRPMVQLPKLRLGGGDMVAEYGYRYTAPPSQGDIYLEDSSGKSVANDDMARGYDDHRQQPTRDIAEDGSTLSSYSSSYQYMSYGSRVTRDENQVDMPPPLEEHVASAPFPNSVSLNPTFQDRMRTSGMSANTFGGVQHCITCGTANSPEWRKGPSGKKELCNACGLRFSRSKQKKEGIVPQRRKKDKDAAHGSAKRDASPVRGSAVRGKRILRKGLNNAVQVGEVYVKNEAEDDGELEDSTVEYRKAAANGFPDSATPQERVKQERYTSDTGTYSLPTVEAPSLHPSLPKWNHGVPYGGEPYYHVNHNDNPHGFRRSPLLAPQDAVQYSQPPNLPPKFAMDAQYSNHVTDYHPSRTSFQQPATYTTETYEQSYSRVGESLVTRNGTSSA